MKNLAKFPVSLLYLVVLVSCSTDSPGESTTDSPKEPQIPVFSGENPGDNNAGNDFNPYFGFLDGDGSSTTYIDMPIESSPTNLIVGRWQIIKLGIDENNDGNIKYYDYQDYKHKNCGVSFLQFNNNGIVFENSYYRVNGACSLYVEIDDYELIEENRFKIYAYDNIYLVNVDQSELILKYDWNFENSLYGPAQVYYYYQRVQI